MDESCKYAGNHFDTPCGNSKSYRGTSLTITVPLAKCVLCKFCYCDAHFEFSEHHCSVAQISVCYDCNKDVYHRPSRHETSKAMVAHKLDKCQPKEIKEEKKTLEEEKKMGELTEERDSKKIHECCDCKEKVESPEQCSTCLKYYCFIHLPDHDCEESPMRLNRTRLESAKKVSKREADASSIEIAPAIVIDFVHRKYGEEYDQDAYQSTRATSSAPSSDKPQKVFKPETGAIPKNVSFTDSSIPQEGKHTQSDSEYAEMCQSLSEQVELPTSEEIQKVFKPETGVIPKNVPFIDSSIPQDEKHTQSDSKYAEMCQSLSELELRRQKHEGKSSLDLIKKMVDQIPRSEGPQSNIQIPRLEGPQSNGQIPRSEGLQSNGQIPMSEEPQSNGQIPRSEGPQSNGQIPKSERFKSNGQIPRSEGPQLNDQIPRSEGPQSDGQIPRSDRDELPIPCLPMDLINISIQGSLASANKIPIRQ